MRLFIPAILILFFLPAPVKAQLAMSFNAAADNSIYQELPGNSNGSGYHLFAGNTGSARARRALIKFNISIPVPLGNYSIVITSAMLTLHMNKTRSGSTNIGLYAVVSPWGEGASNAGGVGGQEGTGTAAMVQDATWTCGLADGAGGCGLSWSSPGGDYNATPSAITSVGPAIASYNWTSTNLAADVQAWVDNPASNFGWIILGDEANPTTADRFSSRENLTAADRPVLSLTYNLLPVKFTGFNAVATKSGNLLNWQTAQEFDNDHFTVEHSLNGTDFVPIGQVAGHGTTSLAHSYSYLHAGVSGGKHFYRLAQIDMSGRVYHSSIVSVNDPQQTDIIQISPNPVKDQLAINCPDAPGSRYTIVSSSGATLSNGYLKGNTLEAGQLPKGFYFILVETKAGQRLRGYFLKE